MFTVYILINNRKQTYVGCSGNFELRLIEHNNPLGKKRGWTRLKGPWKLLHKEHFCSKKLALKREHQLKSGIGRDFIKSLIPTSPPG